ncbi:MAG: septum formation initiator family protein [Pseudomonadota bacterium]|nr:septum formation initiator family protein [Pseudomonadota bacterium]
MIYLPRFRVIPIACLIVSSYFMYHGIYGAHGYWRLKQVQVEIDQARQRAEEYRAHRSFLELKVKSLSDNSLDTDQLEESALHFLSMGKPTDIILFSN